MANLSAGLVLDDALPEITDDMMAHLYEADVIGTEDPPELNLQSSDNEEPENQEEEEEVAYDPRAMEVEEEDEGNEDEDPDDDDDEEDEESSFDDDDPDEVNDGCFSDDEKESETRKSTRKINMNNKITASSAKSGGKKSNEKYEINNKTQLIFVEKLKTTTRSLTLPTKGAAVPESFLFTIRNLLVLMANRENDGGKDLPGNYSSFLEDGDGITLEAADAELAGFITEHLKEYTGHTHVFKLITYISKLEKVKCGGVNFADNAIVTTNMKNSDKKTLTPTTQVRSLISGKMIPISAASCIQGVPRGMPGQICYGFYETEFKEKNWDKQNLAVMIRGIVALMFCRAQLDSTRVQLRTSGTTYNQASGPFSAYIVTSDLPTERIAKSAHVYWVMLEIIRRFAAVFPKE